MNIHFHLPAGLLVEPGASVPIPGISSTGGGSFATPSGAGESIENPPAEVEIGSPPAIENPPVDEAASVHVVDLIENPPVEDGADLGSGSVGPLENPPLEAEPASDVPGSAGVIENLPVEG